MAVSDPTGKLGMEFPSPAEKYEELTRRVYINGKPELQGKAATRALDAILSRTFGILFSVGKKEPDPVEEYERLTGNFKRIGKVALALRFLGPLDRLIVRLAMRMAADLCVRQQYGGAQKGSNALEAARGYFAITDLFNWNIEVLDVNDAEVAFKFLECPIGYVAGDSMKVCMASNKWDRHCCKVLGGRLNVEALIPEGADGCVGHIVAADDKLPESWRRYPKFRI